MGAVAQTLAQVSGAAYGGPLPAGFTAVSFGDAPNGIFINQNAAARVATGTLSGQQVLVLSFRGSDDRQDWINDIRDINADYSKFANLISEVDTYAAQHGLKVVVTGHSLGGALAQDFMSQHPDGAVHYVGVTFGSPGAEISAAADSRITNYVVADDPIPFLGLHRAAIGQLVSSSSALANAYASELADPAIGLTTSDVLGSIPFLTSDYVNRGQTITLNPPGSNAALSLTNVLSANPGEHDLSLYASLAAGTSDPLLGAINTSGPPGSIPVTLKPGGVFVFQGTSVVNAGGVLDTSSSINGTAVEGVDYSVSRVANMDINKYIYTVSVAANGTPGKTFDVTHLVTFIGPQTGSTDWHFTVAANSADVDAQASAILLQSFVSGLSPSASDYTRTLSTASNFINQAGGNVAAAWQQLGAAFADDPRYNSAFLQKYGTMTDAQAVNAVYQDMFGKQPTSGVAGFLTNELSYYEGVYKPYFDAGDPNGVTRARGTMIGDLFQQIEDPRNGHFTDNIYYAAEQHFASEIAMATAQFGVSGGLFF